MADTRDDNGKNHQVVAAFCDGFRNAIRLYFEPLKPSYWRRLRHRVAHLFGWNTGNVYTWWDSDTGKLMIGFRCSGCDTISGVHEGQAQRHG